MTVSVGVQSHPGRKRSENQDRVSRAATPFGDLYVLADGVGGLGGGGEAAQAVVGGFAEYLKSHAGQPLAQALQDAARDISSSLRSLSEKSDRTYQGMSSTVVLALIDGNRTTIAHAGDSRAYLARDNRLRLLTRDDSLVERLVSQGLLTPAQAREHPDASVLTQAIGQRSEVKLTITDFDLQPGDALLLCSDGLWGFAEHAEMEAIALSDNISVSGVAEALMNLALQGGGGDNISIQFVRFSAPLTGFSRPVKWWGIGPRFAIPLGLSVVCLLAAGALLTYFNLQHPLRNPNPGMHLDDDSSPNQAADSLPPKSSPASSSTLAGEQGTPPAQGAKPGSPKLVLVTAAGAPLPDWSAKLQGLGTLEIRQEQGAKDCLSLMQPKGVLYNLPRATKVAQEIQRKLKLDPSVVIALSPDLFAKCGDADLVVLPARPSTATR